MKCKIGPALCLQLAFGGNRPRMMPHVYNAQNNLTAKNDLFSHAVGAQTEQALLFASLPDKRRPLQVTHWSVPSVNMTLLNLSDRRCFSLLMQKEMCQIIYNRKYCWKKIYPPVIRIKVPRMSAKPRTNFKENSSDDGDQEHQTKGQFSALVSLSLNSHSRMPL